MASVLLTCQASGQTTTVSKRTFIEDNQAFSIGSYLAYIAPFNRGALVPHQDYDENIALATDSFPNRTLLSWWWPRKPAPAGVYDFSAIDFGNYNNTVVPIPIPPRLISQIGVLTEVHDAYFSGEMQGFDVIDDLFLTTVPGDSATNAVELEVFLHTPDYSAAYVRGARQLGTFTGSGTTWIVAIDSKEGHMADILFMPRDRADLEHASIDLKAMMTHLTSIGVLSNKLYFNGFAFGTETQLGAGSMVVNEFRAHYE